MSLTRRSLIWIVATGLLAACGQSTADGNGSPTPTGSPTEAGPVDTDITPYLESIYNFDDEYFEAARRVVSPGSPAARYLLHAERARVAYEAADRTAELEDPRVEVAAVDDGYEACFPTAGARDCQVLTDLEFDDDGLLIHYKIDDVAWTDNVITFSEGASWIEGDGAMIELTSVSVGTLGTLRLTLRHISLDDEMLPDPEAPMLYRASGIGDESVIPDCDRSDAPGGECVPVDYVYGVADAPAGSRPEIVMFIYAAQPENETFSLDDHVGIPLIGETSKGVAWIDLRTGRGVIEVEPIEDGGTDDD